MQSTPRKSERVLEAEKRSAVVAVRLQAIRQSVPQSSSCIKAATKPKIPKKSKTSTKKNKSDSPEFLLEHSTELQENSAERPENDDEDEPEMQADGGLNAEGGSNTPGRSTIDREDGKSQNEDPLVSPTHNADMQRYEKKEKQRAKKAATLSMIKSAHMWSPSEDWAFEIAEIPTDKNLDDFTVGMLVWARHQNMITKTALIQKFPLVFTEAGKIRKERKRGGRAFCAPDGSHVTVEGVVLHGDEPKEMGPFSVETLSTHDDYESWRKEVIEGKKPKGKSADKESKESVKERKRSSRRRHRGGPPSKKVRMRNGAEIIQSSSEESGSSGDSSSSNGLEQDALPQPPRTRRRGGIRFQIDGFGQSTPTDDESVDVTVLQQKLSHYELEVKGLQKKLKQAHSKDAGVEKLVQELIRRSSDRSVNLIKTTVEEDITFSIWLDKKTNGGGEAYLAFIETEIKNTLAELQTYLATSRTLDEVYGEKAREGRDLLSDEELAAQLQVREAQKERKIAMIARYRTPEAQEKKRAEETDAVLKSIMDRKNTIMDKELSDWRLRFDQQEEEKV
jgi:hypothetical protein